MLAQVTDNGNNIISDTNKFYHFVSIPNKKTFISIFNPVKDLSSAQFDIISKAHIS